MATFRTKKKDEREPLRSRQASLKANMKIGEYTFKLEAPDSHQVNEYQKSQTKYKIIFDKVKELIRDDPNIQKEDTTPPLSISSIPSDIRQFRVPASDYSDLSLPKVDRETYTQLLLRAFNELNFKWTVADKVWIKHYNRRYSSELRLDGAANFIKIYPEKQISKKGDRNFTNFLKENSKANAAAAAAAAASIPITEAVSSTSTSIRPSSTSSRPLKKQKESKSRDYGLGYSTEIIAVKKNTNDKKKKMFVVDDKQNCIYDFYEWKQQSFDYDNKIPEPGPVGFIKGPNMPQPLFNWKTYRDTSFIKGESQRNLPNIFNDRGQEIGGLFVYLELKDGFEVEFFPEPEPEREKILLKRIKYKKSRKGTKNRKEKSYLKSKDSNDDGDFDIYTDPQPKNNDDGYFVIYADDPEDNEKPRKIGEMDADDGIIRFDEHGIDSEDDENESMNYPHEFVTLYQESPNTIKKNKALSTANKELVDFNLGGFLGVGWIVSWDSGFKDNKGNVVGGLLYENKEWFINVTDRREGDHVFERHIDDVRLYDTQDNGSGIIKKNLDKFLTNEQKYNGWRGVYSKSKFKTYYFNQNTGKSVWQYRDVTVELNDKNEPFHETNNTNTSSGGKRKTKKYKKSRNRTLKK